MMEVVERINETSSSMQQTIVEMSKVLRETGEVAERATALPNASDVINALPPETVEQIAEVADRLSSII